MLQIKPVKLTEGDLEKFFFMRDETISTGAYVLRLFTNENGDEKVTIKLSSDGSIGERFSDGRMYRGIDSPWDLVVKEFEYTYW